MLACIFVQVHRVQNVYTHVHVYVNCDIIYIYIYIYICVSVRKYVHAPRIRYK